MNDTLEEDPTGDKASRLAHIISDVYFQGRNRDYDAILKYGYKTLKLFYNENYKRTRSK